MSDQVINDFRNSTTQSVCPIPVTEAYGLTVSCRVMISVASGPAYDHQEPFKNFLQSGRSADRALCSSHSKLKKLFRPSHLELIRITSSSAVHRL